MFVEMYSQIPSADEVMFLRVTANLPHYNTYRTWYTIDKSDPSITIDTKRDYNLYYQVPYWEHPMLDSLITWPLVKLFWHDDNAKQATASMPIFRTLAWMMLCGGVLLALSIVRRRTKSNLILFLSSLVLFAAIPFFAAWHGDNWWYYDTFMFFAMIVALATIGTKYERFIYIPLAFMVGSELTGFLLLAPFVIRNPRTALCGLAIMPHFIMAGIVTGNMMYMLDFWWRVSGVSNADTYSKGYRIWVNIKYGWATLAATMPAFIYQVFKKNIFYSLLFLALLFIGYFWIVAYYHYWGVILIGIVLVGITLSNMIERKGAAATV
jgi:hypothetical protein